MDPAITPLLLLGFLIALAVSMYELKGSLAAPVCPQCVHCKTIAREKAQQQQELNDWYARRWRFEERDDDDLRRP